jgi:hypothetical protein
MTSVNMLKRIELLEQAIATQHSPKLVFVWTASLAARVGEALGPGYECVVIKGIGGCADDDEIEAMIRRDDPAESARLDRLLAGEVW